MDNNSYLFSKESIEVNECILALKDLIQSFHKDIICSIKYNTYYFNYQKHNLCYIWIDKKLHHPYVGFLKGAMIKHKQLEQESRTQVAIFRINPSEDIPVETLYNILSSAIKIYK